jgi:hypothetical protein
MGNLVKVKKTKTLRFKLISVLYLLFISLSILQIPIEWFRINATVADYMNNSTTVKMDIPVIINAMTELERIDAEFSKEIGYDAKLKKFKEPESYSATDMYFIRWGNGDKLFAKMTQMKDYFMALPEDHPKRKEFEKLFNEDLKNGLKSNKNKLWVEWKFKHVPAAVVKTWIADLKLRLKLLNGGIIVKEEQNKDYLVLMAYNIEAVRPGDTVKIVVFDHDKLAVTATENDNVFNLNKWNGDTLLFIPPYVGQYALSFKKNGYEEVLKVTSVAREFERETDHGFNIFYEGKPAELQYINLLNTGSAVCSCDPNLTLNSRTNKVSFTPQSAGWCNFTIKNKDGMLLLKDSIYVQKLPEPYIHVDGSSDMAISLSRLTSNGRIVLHAKHPDLVNFKYKINGLKYRLVGVNNELQTISGTEIVIPADMISKLRYVVIEEATIETEVNKMVKKEPIVIQIRK